jgi:hypothetical protein
LFWKPESGHNLIRILPNPYNRDYPFSEFYFYYDFGKTIISPKSFGRPDPIVEFCQTLRRSKNKETAQDDYRLALKLEPKARTFVMVLVRGKESEGPKFWGFGRTVFSDLLGFMADPDYGDITDPLSGRDVTVEFSPDAKDPRQNKTTIRVKPNVSKAFTDESILQKVKDTKNPADIWTEPSYDELKVILEKYLAGEPIVEKSTADHTNVPADSASNVISSKPVLTPEMEKDIDSMFDDLDN